MNDETQPAEAANEPGQAAQKAVHQPLPDIAYHLYFGQFQQLSWLAVALAGGALAMHQLGLFKGRPWNGVAAAIFFGISALVAVMGPMELTRGVTEGKDVRKSMKRYLTISLLLLGMGTGALVMGLIRTALKGG